MTAVEFLKKEGLIPENREKWVVTFSGGTQRDLVELLEEFRAQDSAEPEQPTPKKRSRKKSGDAE